jgi:hypothetical protein
MLLSGVAQIEETATQLAERLEILNFQATEHASLLTIALPRGFTVSAVSPLSHKTHGGSTHSVQRLQIHTLA